jgi:hypothetical protein
MLGGMSGGPVVLADSDPIFCAVGVCSKDASDPLSFNNHKLPGSSFVIPAAWIHALPAPTPTCQPLQGLLGSNMLSDVAPPFIRALALQDPLAAFYTTDERVPRAKATQFDTIR